MLTANSSIKGISPYKFVSDMVNLTMPIRGQLSGFINQFLESRFCKRLRWFLIGHFYEV